MDAPLPSGHHEGWGEGRSAVSDVRYRLLGPMEVTVGGEPAKLPGAAERALLVQLLLAPGRTIPATLLVDRLWSESTLPVDPMNALQIRVSKLRRALAAVGIDGVVSREGVGYRAAVTPGQVDALDFAERVRAARTSVTEALADGGYTEQHLEAYDVALELWRGEPLTDFATEQWAIAEAARLSELRLAALTERAQVALGLGRHLAVVVEARARRAALPRARPRGRRPRECRGARDPHDPHRAAPDPGPADAGPPRPDGVAGAGRRHPPGPPRGRTAHRLQVLVDRRHHRDLLACCGLDEQTPTRLPHVGGLGVQDVGERGAALHGDGDAGGEARHDRQAGGAGEGLEGDTDRLARTDAGQDPGEVGRLRCLDDHGRPLPCGDHLDGLGRAGQRVQRSRQPDAQQEDERHARDRRLVAGAAGRGPDLGLRRDGRPRRAGRRACRRPSPPPPPRTSIAASARGASLRR